MLEPVVVEFVEAIVIAHGADEAETFVSPLEPGIAFPLIVAFVGGVGGRAAREMLYRIEWRLLTKELVEESRLRQPGECPPGGFALVLETEVGPARLFETGVLIGAHDEIDRTVRVAQDRFAGKQRACDFALEDLLGLGTMTTPVRSMSKKSIERVRPGTNFGV